MPAGTSHDLNPGEVFWVFFPQRPWFIERKDDAVCTWAEISLSAWSVMKWDTSVIYEGLVAVLWSSLQVYLWENSLAFPNAASVLTTSCFHLPTVHCTKHTGLFITFVINVRKSMSHTVCAVLCLLPRLHLGFHHAQLAYVDRLCLLLWWEMLDV